MAGRVQDKVAIVTGGGTGIGRGIAEALAREGAKVVIANRSAETGEAAAQKIRDAGGTAEFLPTDVSREEDCQKLIQAAADTFGGADVLVNNAGIFPRMGIEETDEELWDRIMAINLKGAFFTCKHALPVMRERGGGSIINVGSIHGLGGGGSLFAYAVSKAGMLGLTRNVAKSHAQYKIRCNYLIPGWVVSEGEIKVHSLEGHDEEWLRAQGQRLRMGRHQTPEDSGYAAVYLASDESFMVNGCVLNVDSGDSML
jgi:NAD(P)-dependent dehydrogenase (short-subunit alcohol dehydrogenase family)